MYARSDCKVPLGVKVVGVKGNSYHAAGSRFPIMLGYNETRDYAAKGRPIHRLTENINMRNLERYGHLTMEKINSTISPVTGIPDVSFVDVVSPIVDLIRANQKYLQVDVNSFVAVRGKHLLIDNALIEECKHVLKHDFFDTTPFLDLRTFGISVERLDKQAWDAVSGIESFNPNNDKIVRDFLHKQNLVTVELRVTYLLHAQKSAENAAYSDVPTAARAAASIATTGY